MATACGAIDSASADPDPDPSNPDAVDPTEADGTTTVDQAAAVGRLAEPSIMATGATKVTVLPSAAGAVSGVQINGGLDLASYARVAYWLDGRPMSATAQLTVNAAPGAAFALELMGGGTAWPAKLLYLQRMPTSDALVVTAGSGTVSCGSLPSGKPTDVTIAFDGDSQTFDVLIGGAAACTNVPGVGKSPVIGFRIMDLGNQGYGGRVQFSGPALF